ncbi:MAG: glycosyltransferase, partial [Gemmataceae bacterium]|nr:glycosyltransferase [Gemmataceae bacterium]
PGETGFVVPPRNSDRLADALRALLRDTTLRARMGAAGRARVENSFTEREMVRQTIALYRKVRPCPRL